MTTPDAPTPAAPLHSPGDHTITNTPDTAVHPNAHAHIVATKPVATTAPVAGAVVVGGGSAPMATSATSAPVPAAPLAAPVVKVVPPPLPTVKPVRTAVALTSAESAAARHLIRPRPQPVTVSQQAFISLLASTQLAGWSLSTTNQPTKASLTAMDVQITASKDGQPDVISGMVLITPGPTADHAWQLLAMTVLNQLH